MTVTEQKIISLDEDERFYIPLRKLFPREKLPNRNRLSSTIGGTQTTLNVSSSLKNIIDREKKELGCSSQGHVVEYWRQQSLMKEELLKYAEELQQTLQQYSGLMMKVSKMQAEMVEDKLVNKYNMVQNLAIEYANGVKFWDALNLTLNTVPPETKRRFLQQLNDITWTDGQYRVKVFPLLENLFNHTINQSKAIITYAFQQSKGQR